MTPTGRIFGILAILVSTCFEAIGQFAFKRAADNRPAGSIGPFAAIFGNLHWVLFGWLSFILEGLMWSTALYFLDLTVAHPIGSLVFVVVAVLSRIFLHEKVSPRRWMGIGLILTGTVLVAFN
jgi:drug/metabolite transporter (DMT)-like permease